MQKPYIKNQKDGWLTVGGTDISVFKTFDCGQCFRFDPVPGSPYPCEVEGVAFRKYVRFADSRDGELMVYSSPGDFENIWRAYLDLDTDYAAADELITLSLIHISMYSAEDFWAVCSAAHCRKRPAETQRDAPSAMRHLTKYATKVRRDAPNATRCSKKNSRRPSADCTATPCTAAEHPRGLKPKRAVKTR